MQSRGFGCKVGAVPGYTHVAVSTSSASISGHSRPDPPYPATHSTPSVPTPSVSHTLPLHSAFLCPQTHRLCPSPAPHRHSPCHRLHSIGTPAVVATSKDSDLSQGWDEGRCVVPSRHRLLALGLKLLPGVSLPGTEHGGPAHDALHVACDTAVAWLWKLWQLRWL